MRYRGLLLSLGVSALAFALHAGDAQFLMVDENGEISPPGYTLGIDQVAKAAAFAAAASNRVMAVQEATEAAREVVSNLTEVLVGNTSFGYIDGFVVSFGGTAAVSANAACRIVKFAFAQEQEMIGGVLHDGHYIWYNFSEPMNSTPYIKWKSALSTNEWNIVPTQDLVRYDGPTVLDGVTYANLYRSTAFTPAGLTQPVYVMAYCEVAAPDGDGSMFPIRGGIRINGQEGFTGVVTNDNAVFRFTGGLLMARPENIAGGAE